MFVINPLLYNTGGSSYQTAQSIYVNMMALVNTWINERANFF